jgi:hypothetical protein
VTSESGLRLYLARHGVVRRALPSRLRPQVVVFPAHGHRHIRLVLGRRSVGHYDPIAGRWIIKRLYRLLVDEQGLNRLTETDHGV